MQVKNGLYIKDAQLFLDGCIKSREPVYVTALKADGTICNYDGWLVSSSHHTAGTHDFRNPVNGQIRKVKDVLIFKINGHPVYL